MPLTIPSLSGLVRINVEPLTSAAFAPTGTAISNPERPEQAISANQGSALKYVDVSPLLDFYAQAPSRVRGKAAMNMFVCSPRPLEDGKDGEGNDAKVFKVGILERHPFTTQTFTPLGLSPSDNTKFLVIVAPTLPLSERDIDLPVPRSAGNTGVKLPGRGLPDLSKIRAFLADGSQAVTYGAGTWHAPMVVLGQKDVAFVVSQFVNGVQEEDCQEVVWEGDVKVVVPKREEEAKVVPVVSDKLDEGGHRAIHDATGRKVGDKAAKL